MKKYKVVIDENNIPRICRIIGIYYKLNVINPNDRTILRKIELGTLCFSPSTKKFYYSSAKFNMPRKLYLRYQEMLPNNNRLEELEKMCIYPYDDIKDFLRDYNKYIEKIETEVAIEKYLLDKDIELISRRHQKLSYANQMLNSGKKIEELIIEPERKAITDEKPLEDSNSIEKKKIR